MHVLFDSALPGQGIAFRYLALYRQYWAQETAILFDEAYHASLHPWW